MSHLLNQKESRLQQLKQQLMQLQKLNDIFYDYIPEEWRPYCQVVRIDPAEKKLVVSTSLQELVTSLRYMQKQIVTQLQKHSKAFQPIQKIECIYTAMLTQREAKARTPLRSNSSAEACLQAAANCPSHLQEALKRLSNVLKQY